MKNNAGAVSGLAAALLMAAAACADSTPPPTPTQPPMSVQLTTAPTPAPVAGVAKPTATTEPTPPAPTQPPVSVQPTTAPTPAPVVGVAKPTPTIAPTPPFKDVEGLLAQLTTNREKWESGRFNDYSYTYQRICPQCLPGSNPVPRYIRDGFLGRGRGLGTFYDLFDSIQSAIIDRNFVEVSISYQPEFGYPVAVFFVYAANIHSKDWGFKVSHFVPGRMYPIQCSDDVTPVIAPTAMPPSGQNLAEAVPVPPIPYAGYVRVDVVDERGQRVCGAEIEIATDYEGQGSLRNFSWIKSVESLANGLLGMTPYPENSSLLIRALMPDGRESGVLLIRAEEFWDYFKATERGFIISHQFQLGKRGTISYADYGSAHTSTYRAPFKGKPTAYTLDVDPSWSPDGSKIVFASSRDGNFELYVMDPDGSNQERLTNTPMVSESEPRWSPDGRKIAFKVDVPWSSPNNFEMNADGSNPLRWSRGVKPTDLSWSPDGSKITFMSRGELWVVGDDGSALTKITNLQPKYRAQAPAWSPDGTKIAFQTNLEGNMEIYVVNADGSDQTRLTNSAASNEAPAWSPDSKKIVFQSGRERGLDIYVIDADGTSEARLTNNIAHDLAPAWSPDGTKIAFQTARDGNFEIYVMDSDGSNKTRLTNDPR